MSTTINLEYCGIDGSGPTVREAKQDAARKLTALVNDLRRTSPLIILIEGHAALVWRDANGWTYRLITDENGALRDGPQYGSSSSADDREATERSVRRHLAMNAWTHDKDDAWLAAIPGLTEADRRQIGDWCAWQRRYKVARDAGKTDAEARDIAGGRAV